MLWFKKELSMRFICLLFLHALPASAEFSYDLYVNDYSLGSVVKQTPPWKDDNVQITKPSYCLTPSDPGCSNMWNEEKKKENAERIKRHEEKRKYNYQK